MRHSNPVPQHGVFSAPFPVLSLFVRHSCFACLLPFLILSLTSNFASSSPVFSISFYLPFFALHVCRLIHKLSLCFVIHVVFKITIIIFSQTQLAMQFPAKERRAAAQLATRFPAEKLTRVVVQGLSVSFQVGLHGVALVRTGGRAVGRTDGGDVITKPNFLALMGLPKSLSYGTPPRAP